MIKEVTRQYISVELSLEDLQVLNRGEFPVYKLLEYENNDDILHVAITVRKKDE